MSTMQFNIDIPHKPINYGVCGFFYFYYYMIQKHARRGASYIFFLCQEIDGEPTPTI